MISSKKFFILQPKKIIFEDNFSTYADTTAMLAVWTVGPGTNWTLSNKTALHTAGATNVLGHLLSLVVGATYKIDVGMTGRTTSFVVPRFNGSTISSGPNLISNGLNTFYVTNSSPNIDFELAPGASGFDGAITYVRIVKL